VHRRKRNPELTFTKLGVLLNVLRLKTAEAESTVLMGPVHRHTGKMTQTMVTTFGLQDATGNSLTILVRKARVFIREITVLTVLT